MKKEKKIINKVHTWYVVSDIHSFATELKASLKGAGFDRKDPAKGLIVCGDVFDRGNETVEVYRYLSTLPKYRCILIKGNHELLYEGLLKKRFPDSYDFSNHTTDTFCQIAGYSPEIMTIKYWYKLGEDDPYGRMQQTWQEILKEVKESPITAWLRSTQWKSYYELDKYIFVHSFIPLKDNYPGGYYSIHDDPKKRYEYISDWRNASDHDWEKATWGCPYQNYLDGYFKEEAINGKVLVCGHWDVTDFRQAINNKITDNTDIYFSEHLIGLDGGVWQYNGTNEYYHPQNVLVIDDSDFNTCYDKYGNKLEYEKSVPIIRTVTPKDEE